MHTGPRLLRRKGHLRGSNRTLDETPLLWKLKLSPPPRRVLSQRLPYYSSSELGVKHCVLQVRARVRVFEGMTPLPLVPQPMARVQQLMEAPC